MNNSLPIVMTEEVQTALNEKKAVVALESTIISHGMPYPQNVESAQNVENFVREGGAVPATIAVISGVIHVGLTKSELSLFGQNKKVVKASTRTLPQLLVSKEDGATTVAATIFVAGLCGIKVMVTGGIGGVHRGAETTFDISADLTQIAKVPVAVVCAGAKAILDIDKTLEYLDTLMVPVIGYGQSEFPAFYTRGSGHTVETRFDDPAMLAHFLHSHWQLRPECGVIVGNPVPENEAMDEIEIQNAINRALIECEKLGIRGKPVTPFLLDRIQKLTAGRSLKTNMALIENNARLGGKLAKEFEKRIAF